MVLQEASLQEQGSKQELEQVEPLGPLAAAHGQLLNSKPKS